MVRARLQDARPDVVFHLAAQIDVRVSVERPAYDARTNIEGTVNVLEASRLAGAARFVMASTGGAIYGDTEVIPTPEAVEPLPVSAYGQSKFCAERYLNLYERLYGFSTIALRFSNVYGPRQDPHGEAGVIAIFTGRLGTGQGVTIFGDGTQTRDYIYVGDLVEAIIAAADSYVREAMNLGTEEETSVLRLYEILSEFAGSRPHLEFAPARLGELERSCLDATRASELLGWQAGTRIEQGLRLTWEAAAAASGHGVS